MSCGFFLWADDAVSREMRAVISNTRSEPEISTTPVDTARDRRTVQGHIEASNKWIKDLGKFNEEEFGDWTQSADEEEKRAAPLLPSAFPETPRKAMKTDIFITPGSKRKRDAETLPTPAAEEGPSDDIFINPPTLRPVGGIWDGDERFGLRSPSKTPTPNRFRESTEPINSRGEVPSQSYDIIDEVLEILKHSQLDVETNANLHQLLRKHALRISGIAKGRDITRVALKQKDAKIAELKEKVAKLEAERELDRTVIRHFKNDMSYSISTRNKERERKGSMS